MKEKVETSKQPSTKYEGLGAAITAELMIGYLCCWGSGQPELLPSGTYQQCQQMRLLLKWKIIMFPPLMWKYQLE